ncbi:uncharacterized protein V6R79_003472 [Siganus canaliculatus]
MEPFGNISLGLSDEHGNEVDLECSIVEPRELTKITWEQVNQFQLTSNITFSVDIECPVDREKYERLWRLIAYYSNVPAHLQRGIMLRKDPHPTYAYRQDSEKDALYYTGVKVNMMAQPEWLMQTTADLQLNRLHSSAKTVKLILSTDLSETVETEMVRRQRRTWVTVESTNATRKVSSAILGNPTQIHCNIHSSSQPVIHWMLPDGSKMEAPYSSADNRVSVSEEGQLVFKTVSHTDAGIYYCVAKVPGDLAVLAYHLTVQESSSPQPGEDASTKPIEGFAGNPISLPCNTSGSPDAEINWILPNSNILNIHTNTPRALVFSNGTLHIPQAQVLDNGYYKCIAINQHGMDTLATKVTLIRRKGPIRPLRKFPASPQSAAGVNTQIKVPTEDVVEASGDIEAAQVESPISRLDPIRRRIPGGMVPGRRGAHPSRHMWRRPPILRKPTGSRVDERKNVVEGRRKINVSKSKIDPEKWADILAKIRDRKTQGTVTPHPVQHTTERTLTEQSTPKQETVEGSSDGGTVLEKEGQAYFTTPPTTAQHTQMTMNNDNTQGPVTYVTSNSYTGQNPYDVTSTSQHTDSVHATEEAHTTQASYTAQHTSPNMNWDLHETSKSVFFLPQTTSVPTHAVTFWQPNTNAASSGSTFSLRENHSANAHVDIVETADSSETSEKSEDSDVANSNSETEASSSGSQMIPSVDPSESDRNQKENGKYVSETATMSQLHTHFEHATTDYLHSQAMLTTASPTTEPLPTTTRSSEGSSSTRLRQPNSRKRNGGRRRRPNKRKQKLNKPTQFTAVTPENDPTATVRPTVLSQPKIDPLQVTAASFNPTVPFSSSQAASSGRLSHEESTLSGHDAEVATEPSSPRAPPETNNSGQAFAKPLFKSTSEAPLLPRTSPGVGHGKMSFQTALGFSENASATEHLDIFTSSTQQTHTDRLPPPVQPLEETQIVNEPVAQTESSAEGFHTGSGGQTDLGQSQPDYETTTSQISEKMLLNEHSTYVYPSGSASSPMDYEVLTTSGYISGLITTPTLNEMFHHSPGQNDVNTGSDTDAPFTNIVTAMYPTASSSWVTVVPSVTPYVKLPETSTTGTKPGYSPGVTTQDVPEIHNIPNIRGQDQQIPSITTPEPQSTSDFHSATQSAGPELTPPPATNPPSTAWKLTSRETIKQTTTPTPTTPVMPTEVVEVTNSPDVPIKYQLPEPGSVPRGKPRITKNNLQTFSVKAETDAQLPCEAEGEPMPFLSWTKVATGASIAQNTRVQRFEVHPNGTLIIRNTQPMDGGQYLCTVQNQYGTDKKVVNLVILSQHPRVLEPRQRDVTVHLGGRVDLECRAEGHPVPRVTWVLPNHVHMAASTHALVPQQRVSVLSNGTLRISQATSTDRGIYRCIGSSAAGADTVSVRLYVSAFPPSIQQTQHENVTLPEGSSAYFHCTASGVPPPVIQWITPNGAQLASSLFTTGRNLVVFPNGTLYLRGLGPSNAGRYECLASNSLASSRRTLNLSLKRNPAAVKARISTASPQRTDVIYGDRLQLDCVATGDPDPRIIWRTPSKKLVDAQYSFDSRIKVFPNGTIAIHSVTDKDSGDYLCVARNKMGDDYVLLRVNVLTRPAKIKQKPQQSSQEVIYGGNLKVDCVASGLPNPKISWALPDGTMVNPVKQKESSSGGRSRRYVVFDNGTLYFNDVGMPEEGDYTCYAENQLGKDEMKVRVKVKVTRSPPQILDKDQKTATVFYGETVRLKCSAKGESVPVITWISPTNRVISSTLDKYKVLDDGTLIIQKVQRFDGGNYTCMAKNNAGQDHKVTKLEVLVTSPVINSFNGATNTIKVSAVQDQQKFLDCVAKGTPTPRIMWVLPGNVILPAPYYSNRMAVHQNGSLEIRSPKKSDSGQLVCIARNEGGEVRLVVNLDVKDIIERPQNRGSHTDSLSLTVGSAMTLNCSFEGSTLHQVTWILPGGSLLHSGARFSKFFHRPDGSLIISNPSVAEAGMYRCLGRTVQGLVEQTITLSPGQKPEIINRYPTPVNVMNGERLLLHCITRGDPLRLTWTLPSGVVLNKPQRAGRYAVLANGTLSIQQVSVYDRGSYVCRVTNEYGSSQQSISVIVIAYPPRITNGPPPVTSARHGVAVQLNCIATGIPRVDIAWETPDKTRLAVSAQPRLFGNKYLHPQGSLIIQNPTKRDSGLYRCTARNAIGVDSKETFLKVV